MRDTVRLTIIFFAPINIPIAIRLCFIISVLMYMQPSSSAFCDVKLLCIMDTPCQSDSMLLLML